MKFKKIEVSAFRIYDRPEDGTFDFTTSTDETANFISLYAPNGFGKTSFYDAVEWGMTKTISRFLLKGENKKLANSQNKENKDESNSPSFIKNYNSVLETYVNITDDDNDIRTQKLTKRGKFDLNFDSKPTNTFHKVVLSQEWISAFLKEDNGELRYDKFIKNPELIELDAYYKNLIGLINENKAKIDTLKGNIDDLKEKITETEESDLLEQINECIVTLQSFEEKVTKLEVSSTSKELLDFKKLINPRIFELDEELIINNNLIESYKTAQNGNADIIGFDLYLNKKEILNTTRKNLVIIDSSLKKYKTLEELVNQKNGIEAKQSQEAKNKEDLIKINIDFTTYLEIESKIIDKSKEKKKQDDKLIERRVNISYYEQEKIDYRSKIESYNTSLSKINERLKDIPNIAKEILRLNKGIEENEKLVKPLSSNLKEREEKTKNNEHTKESYKNIIENIKKNDYNLIDGKDFIKTDLETSYLRKIDSINANLTSIKNLENSKTIINLKIDKQKSLSSNITDFITKGLKIAESIKKSNCPLCNHLHDSYEDLEKEILSNKLLDEILQELLGEEKIIDTNINGLQKLITEVNKELISVYTNHISILNDNSKELNIKVLQSQITALKSKLIEFENEKLQLVDKLDGLTTEELSVNLEKQITDIEGLKATFQYFESKNTLFLDKRNEQIELMISQIELLEKDIEELKLNKQYTLVLSWFKENYSGIKITTEKLENLIETNKSLLIKYASEIEKIVTEIAILEKGLSSYKIEDVETQQLQLNELIDKESIKINIYEDFIIKLTGKNLTEITKSNLSDKEIELNKKNLKFNSIKSQYGKLEIHMNVVEPYLQSEKAKIDILKIEKDLNVWVDKVAPILHKERMKARKHLKGKIKNFFHTDLINEIYKRIDPHPDFKNVEFKPDFDSDNPRLDVFVADQKEEKLLIPNLYFSSAQINILSLSIFLASALNSIEYDCILLDDPIQSMDSINVLSTIDLLRSIIVNQDKQIILSTHDENFHNLLKKKIPKELFKSKFLELESFGKVKVDIN